MSIDDELTPLERRYARVALQVAETPRWLHFVLPGLMLAGSLFGLWSAYVNPLPDFRDTFRNAASAAFVAGGALTFMMDFQLQRALGVVYRRLRAAEPGAAPPSAEALPPAMRRAPPALDAGALRGACLVAFASGLLVCGVALWRFGSGEATPAWAGIAMGSAGGLGAGAALVASFLPGWMIRAARREASGGGPPP
jgi:hypothetical protein